MSGLSALWGRQPVMILAFVQAAIALAMGFGVKLTGEQVALLMAFTAALLGVVAQAKVTPIATLPGPLAAAVVIAANAKVPKLPVQLEPPTGPS